MHLQRVIRYLHTHNPKLFTTLPVFLNDTSFNVITKLNLNHYEVKKYISFLGQFDLTYCDISFFF